MSRGRRLVRATELGIQIMRELGERAIGQLETADAEDKAPAPVGHAPSSEAWSRPSAEEGAGAAEEGAGAEAAAAAAASYSGVAIQELDEAVDGGHETNGAAPTVEVDGAEWEEAAVPDDGVEPDDAAELEETTEPEGEVELEEPPEAEEAEEAEEEPETDEEPEAYGIPELEDVAEPDQPAEPDDTAGAELAAEHARLAAIVESSEDAVIGMSLRGEITSWNAGAEGLFGHTADEAVGERISLVVPQDRASEVTAVLDSVRAGEPVDAIETEGVTKDGERVEVSIRVSPIRDTAGEVAGVSAVARDTTERRRAERYREMHLAVSRALAESSNVEEAMPQILETLGRGLGWEAGAYWAFDGDSTLAARSFWHLPERGVEGYERALEDTSFNSGEGLPGQAVSGRRPVWISEGFSEVESGARAEAATAVGLGGAIALPLVRGDEAFGAIELYRTDPRSPDGELLDAISVISAQVAQLVAHEEAEAELARLRDEFLGLMSQELRQALTSVIGYAEMLSKTESERLSERGNKLLGVIKRNAKREMRLVGDMLMLASIEAGAFELRPGTVDLEALIDESVEAARSAARARGITLSAEIEAVPATVGDADRLDQVMDNLISNALKFTPEGGTVQVVLRRDDQGAVIEINDTGPGIPAEEHERLFDRFYRAPAASEANVPGNGLGLTLAKAIVEAHDGRLEVSSRVGVGSRFQVELPLRAADNTDS